jgi:hypothetical protein
MSLIRLILIRVFIVIGIMVMGFIFLAEDSVKVYPSRVDCSGPVITEITSCKPNKYCLVVANDGKRYQVASPSLNANICLNQSAQ